MAAPIAITGHLCSDARAGLTRDGMYELHVAVRAPAPDGARALELRAVQCLGSGPAAGIAARAQAHHLRRGVRLTLEGTAISVRRGVAHIDGLQRLWCPDIRPHFQETDL